MQTLLHIIEVEILIGLGLYLTAHGAVWLGLRALTGGKPSGAKGGKR